MIPTSGHTGRVVVVDFHRLKWRSVDVTWLEQAETRRRQSEKTAEKSRARIISLENSEQSLQWITY